MAPISTSPQFRKLKLDITTQHKPVASTFASIPRHDAQKNGSSPAVHDAPGNGGGSADRFYSHYGDGRRDPVRANAHHDPYDFSSPAIGSSDDDDVGDLEANFRKRTTSINFDNAVTLDCGNRHSMDHPLPRYTTTQESQQQVSDAEDSSDQDFVEIAPTRKDQHPRYVGGSRYPLLAAAVKGKESPCPPLADQVASLTSETTVSPVLEEARTPPENHTEYLLSPLSSSSPIEFPPFAPRGVANRRGSGPQQTRSFRAELDGQPGFTRRSSRKSSARSSGRSLSSMSPAASFLSRCNTGPLKPTEPDDEGQGIGYESEYIIGKQIGYGGFSVVKEVTTIEDGKSVVHAVKIVRKQLTDKSELENEQIQTQFDHEVEIWRFLNHPYILPLLRVYNTDYATFCITRLNKGGTLHDLIRDTHRKKKRGLDEPLAKRYTYQLASAMRYLHNDVLVVHRDIKPENCLVDMTAPNAEQDGGDILLCDFGMADFVVSDSRDGVEPHSTGTNQNIGPADTSTSIAGSLQYAAPELFTAPTPVFSTAADIWAFGVVVYAILTGKLPFNEGLDAKTTMKIQRGEWDAEPIRNAYAFQQGGAEAAIELVRGCLDMCPERRWTVNEVLACSWLEGCSQMYNEAQNPWPPGL